MHNKCPGKCSNKRDHMSQMMLGDFLVNFVENFLGDCIALLHIFRAYLHGIFPTSWGDLGLSLLNIVVAYLYCIASLHLFIAYIHCISLSHISEAYLYCISLLSCCCLLLFGSWVDFWSFGSVFVRFLVVLGGLRVSWKLFLGVLGALGPLLGDLGSVLATLGRPWAALG